MAQGKKLSLDQKKHLEHLVFEGKKDQEIANTLGVHIDTIIRHRKKVNLKKTGGGKLVKENNKQRETSINKEARTDAEREVAWKRLFEKTSRYTRLEKCMNEDNFNFFIEQWVKYHIQLDDMNISEEDMLESLILLQIRLNENQRNYKDLQDHEHTLKQLLNGRNNQELDLENEEDRFIFEMIESNHRLRQEVNKEYKDLRESYEKTQRAMNTTREQRESRNKVGSETFFHLVKFMNDRDNRKVMGQYAERMRIAMEKQTNKFKKVHKFVDGTQEAILLDGKDYVRKKKEIKEVKKDEK